MPAEARQPVEAIVQLLSVMEAAGTDARAAAATADPLVDARHIRDRLGELGAGQIAEDFLPDG